MILPLSLIFAITLIASICLTPIARRLCVRVGLVDRPRAGELQRWEVARGGGYALIGAFAIGIAASILIIPRPDEEEWTRLIGFAIGLLAIIPIAVLDDQFRLGPKPQLIGQIVAATLPIPFGLYITDIALPSGSILSLPLLVAYPFTIVWVVGMINTLNWLDTMDGLATGVAGIAALVLLIRSATLGQVSVAVLPLALTAVCLGFLPYNFNPARVFMGTSGSMFLGYSLALLAIFGGAKIATALMVLGLPIIDTALVIVQRLAAGRSVFQGGDSVHLAHQLAHRGWTVRQVALAAYTVSAVFGFGGLALSGQYKAWLFTIVIILVIAIAYLVTRRVRPDKASTNR